MVVVALIRIGSYGITLIYLGTYTILFELLESE